MGEGPQVWPPVARQELYTAPACFHRRHYPLSWLWLDQGYRAKEGETHCGALWRANACHYRTAAGAPERGQGGKREGSRADYEVLGRAERGQGIAPVLAVLRRVGEPGNTHL